MRASRGLGCTSGLRRVQCWRLLWLAAAGACLKALVDRRVRVAVAGDAAMCSPTSTGCNRRRQQVKLLSPAGPHPPVAPHPAPPAPPPRSGDIVGVRGGVKRTEKGELSVMVESLEVGWVAGKPTWLQAVGWELSAEGGLVPGWARGMMAAR